MFSEKVDLPSRLFFFPLKKDWKLWGVTPSPPLPPTTRVSSPISVWVVCCPEHQRKRFLSYPLGGTFTPTLSLSLSRAFMGSQIRIFGHFSSSPQLRGEKKKNTRFPEFWSHSLREEKKYTRSLRAIFMMLSCLSPFSEHAHTCPSFPHVLFRLIKRRKEREKRLSVSFFRGILWDINRRTKMAISEHYFFSLLCGK